MSNIKLQKAKINFFRHSNFYYVHISHNYLVLLIICYYDLTAIILWFVHMDLHECFKQSYRTQDSGAIFGIAAVLYFNKIGKEGSHSV